MSGSDKWFRWSFNIFIFLMCFQLGMLLFLKSLYYQAEQRMKDNQAQVSFKCGDFNNDDSYWEIAPSQVAFSQTCQDLFCPDSLWVNPNAGEQKEQLHILSIDRSQPSRVVDGAIRRGYFVDVQFKAQHVPTTLVLLSKNMVQWNLKISGDSGEQNRDWLPESQTSPTDSITKVLTPVSSDPSHRRSGLKEIIVVGPDLIWLDGVPEDTKVTYFDKDKLCAYPTSWEEIENPENQFRRLMGALKEYTGLEVNSFQGKEVGRLFRLPFKSLLAQERAQKESGGRGLASENKEPKLELGLKWKRQGKTIEATQYLYRHQGQTKTIDVPQSTQSAFFEVASQKVFIINNHQFGHWQNEKKKFTSIHVPLNLPALYWPTSLAFNPLTSEIFIYNDDRGGEVYAFNVVTSRWRVMAKQVGYSLVSLAYDSEADFLYGTRFKGQKLSQLVKIGKKGRSIESQDFSKPVDFAKNLWNAQLVRGEKELWLKVAHPAAPEGEVYPLSQFDLQL